MRITEEMYQQMIAEVNAEARAAAERELKSTFFYDEDDAIRRAYRKRDWHKNKGKRRIRDGYEVRYV